MSTKTIDELLEIENLTHAEWARTLREGLLLGQECEDCGNRTAAPKAACVRCRGGNIKTVELPTTGVVLTETTVGVAPEQFTGPYQIGLIDLGDATIMARFEDDIQIGDSVTLIGTVEEDIYPAPLFGLD